MRETLFPLITFPATRPANLGNPQLPRQFRKTSLSSGDYKRRTTEALFKPFNRYDSASVHLAMFLIHGKSWPLTSWPTTFTGNVTSATGGPFPRR